MSPLFWQSTLYGGHIEGYHNEESTGRSNRKCDGSWVSVMVRIQAFRGLGFRVW